MRLLIVVFSILISNLCFAEKEVSPTDVKPIKEVQIDQIDFDALAKEKKIGELAEVVKEEDAASTSLIKTSIFSPDVYPYAEEWAYVNGVFCHIGYYSHSIIYTVMEGFNYGLQTITAYHGAIIDVNYDYVMEYTPLGIILHHFYLDSEVITGSNQVIVFY